MPDIDYARLREPFPADYVQWRVGSCSKDGSKCTLLAYIDARAVMDRLDDVVGPDRWSDAYKDIPGDGVACTLSIQVQGGGWVSKEDAAEASDIEAVKGGRSDAFKRAAVKWGIGRYLYDLDAGWHEIHDGYPPRGKKGVSIPGTTKGRSGPGWVEMPQLPAWALPQTKGSSSLKAEPKTEPPPKPAPAAKVEPKHAPASENSTQQEPSWATDANAFFAGLCEVQHGDITYPALCAYLTYLGKPRPSQMPREKRSVMLRWLRDHGEEVLTWIMDHPDEVAEEENAQKARSAARGAK